MANIGFIGAGSMGAPMIGHLLSAGHAVRVYVRRAAAFDELLATLDGLGVTGRPTYARTPADCAEDAEFVCTNVTTTGDVEQVLFGPDGVAHVAPAGCTVLDFSTISPAGTRDIARRLGETGLRFLDCPVSGGSKGARAATLAIMVGGPAELLDEARPILSRLGASIVHCGPHGAGQVVKACNQVVMCINIQGIAEALHFARANGVDPAVVLPALQAGFAGSKMLDMMGPKMVAHEFTPGIEARLHAKDFGLVADMARQQGLPMPATAVVAAQLRALLDAGWGRDDTSSLIRVLERMQEG